jgi:hypothetical protein
MVVNGVVVKLIADALLIRISIPPKCFAVSSTAFLTLSSSLMSHLIAKAFPPAFSISAAAV